MFFFNDTATTEIYTLSLHDALPISSTCPGTSASSPRCSPESARSPRCCSWSPPTTRGCRRRPSTSRSSTRSEEHTSELQSRQYLVCRLLLEKKKNARTSLNLIFTLK